MTDIFDNKMTKNKEIKKNAINVALSLAVTLVAYFSFNYFNPSFQNLFLLAVFFLVLIYLEVLDKK